jgi:hypothetical protein
MEPGENDTIWFGQGKVTKLAYDGDVITHEVSHAILEPLLPQGDWLLDEYGADGAPGAIDEGLADYFAAALSGDPFIGEYASRNAGAWQSRNLHTPSRCPEALVGRRHADGLLLSSGLWAVRGQLGSERGPRLDRAVIQALQSLQGGPGLSYERLLSSTLEALAREDSEAAKAARAELSHRGLLPACPRILKLDSSQSVAGQAGHFLAPGTRALGVQGLAPGHLQFHVSVPENTAAVLLRFRSPSPRPPQPGDEATPLQLRVLARRGVPLRWKYEATPQHDADSTHELKGDAIRTVRIETAGASDLYLQLVNAGAQDGWYDDLAVSFEPASGPVPEQPVPPDRATPADPPAQAAPVGLIVGLCGVAAGGGLGWWLYRRRQKAS